MKSRDRAVCSCAATPTTSPHPSPPRHIPLHLAARTIAHTRTIASDKRYQHASDVRMPCPRSLHVRLSNTLASHLTQPGQGHPSVPTNQSEAYTTLNISDDSCLCFCYGFLYQDYLTCLRAELGD